MSAVEAILSFDGKHVDQLKVAVAAGLNEGKWDGTKSFFAHEEVLYQTASTWIVKAVLEKGGQIPQSIIDELIVAISSFEHWEPKLHFLQCIQFLGMLRGDAEIVRACCEACEEDKKTLVRVWALDAYLRLSFGEDALLDVVAHKLEAALNDKAASMRARARNLIKEFPQFAR